MKHSKINTLTLMVMVSLGAVSTNAFASQCKIQYSYDKSNGSERVVTKYINRGTTVTINKARMNWVKNTRNTAVKFYLTGAKDVILNKNHVNPSFGPYLTMTTLNKAKCLSSSSNASTPEALAMLLKATGKTANFIATQIKLNFNATRNQVAKALKAAGYPTNQIAGAIKSAFNATQAQVAKALKDAGYAIHQVAGAIKSTFNASKSQVAKALKAAGYAINQIAGAIKSTFNATQAQVAKALKDAGYAASQVASALKK